MGSYACNSCGYITENENEAKFCPQCGASLVDVAARPAPQPVVPAAAVPQAPPAPPAPQVYVRAAPRNVVGPLIKDHLLAQLLEGNQKMSGRFEVRRDGVMYITSNRFGHRVIQVPLEDIANVGLGGRDNILAIHTKTGREVLVKMGNAQKWVAMIQQLMR
jgi:hypothetical protein